MQPNRRYWADKRVCVTGGTGFLGWALVRHVLPLAAHVRILGLPPRSLALAEQLRHLDCIHADIRDASAVHIAVADCDVVFHTAGTVGVWGAALSQMHEIHSLGTRNVLEALPPHARFVHTSSVVTIGARRDRTPLDETAPFQLQRLKIAYVHAKRSAEELVLAAAGRGADALAVNPGYTHGPEDYEASFMGRLCLRVWKGKVQLLPPGGLNFVDVRDVALGHLLAAERGVAGRRYILGGENLLMAEFMRALARVRGMSSRWWFRMPGWFQAVVACGAEVRARIKSREPFPSWQHVRASRYYWHYTSERARAELGYMPRPVWDSLVDTHEWYCRTGQLNRLAGKVICDETQPRERRAA